MSDLKVRPVAGNIGAEVSGVALQSLGDGEASALHRALMEHQVLFFRDQALEPGAQRDLAARFGTPTGHPAFPSVEGYPEVILLESTKEAPTRVDTWHSDVTYEVAPPMGSVLYSLVSPEIGGDTMWSSMYAAYEALSDRMQTYVDGLQASHSFAHGYKESLAAPGGWERLGDAVRERPPVLHPVVRMHPVTKRKCLFVNRLFTTHIDGMGSAESDALLTHLFLQAEQPEFTCRFRWEAGSVAVWDNRCTQHRPINDYFPAHRLMRRVTIAGDAPRASY